MDFITENFIPLCITIMVVALLATARSCYELDKSVYIEMSKNGYCQVARQGNSGWLWVKCPQ